eukprot:g13426.t1
MDGTGLDGAGFNPPLNAGAGSSGLGKQRATDAAASPEQPDEVGLDGDGSGAGHGTGEGSVGGGRGDISPAVSNAAAAMAAFSRSPATSTGGGGGIFSAKRKRRAPNTQILPQGSTTGRVAHVAEAKTNGRAAWLPSLRLIFKHSDTAIAGFMAEIADRAFNHGHTGITALRPPLHAPPSPPVVPKGFRVNARRVLLGSGQKVYERAVREGLRERGVVNRLSWADLEVAEQDSRRWREGMGLLTVVKCYGLLWSANPCRLVYAHWDRNLPRELGKGRCSSVAFSTVAGHLIEGEERFSVEFREHDSSVWLDLYSVSRGSGVLGKVAMPFIRPIQKAFFAGQCREMLNLVKEDG